MIGEYEDLLCFELRSSEALFFFVARPNNADNMFTSLWIMLRGALLMIMCE